MNNVCIEQRLYMVGILKCCGEGPHRVGYQKSQATKRFWKRTCSCWKYGIKNFLTAFGTIPTMFCISYCLLKRTFTIICDNDLIPLPFLQKTTIWSGRIFCIGCCLGVCILLLYFISPFQCICWELYILCYIAFVCMLMSWFAFARLK